MILVSFKANKYDTYTYFIREEKSQKSKPAQ